MIRTSSSNSERNRVARAGQARLGPLADPAVAQNSGASSELGNAPERDDNTTGASLVALMSLQQRLDPAPARRPRPIRPAPATRSICFEFEDWDAGRLCINRQFAEILRNNNLTTFAALDALATGQLVRRIGERTTARIDLTGDKGRQAFYLKRHGRLTLREMAKCLLRATWPVHGARPEWEAILRFHELGIPTMTPVAFGESAGRSLLLTVALEPSVNLLDLIRRTDFQSVSASLLADVVAIARTMHAAGLHHQDFYLNHLLLCPHRLRSLPSPLAGEVPGMGGQTSIDVATTPPPPSRARREVSRVDPNGSEPLVHVIDLGRVRERRRLGTRWIIKDLAQLNYSARTLPVKTRLRFLREYLGRRLTRQDRALIARIARKSAHIDRHTVKNGL